MKLLILSFLSLNLLATDITAHFTINGKSKLMIKPNQAANIELYFTDKKTNEVEKNFKIMHGKIMHMVIFKNDLSEFKHIHPYLDPVTGRFQVSINMPHSDPDNFHLTNTITEPGMYMIMADVEIKGKGMRMAHAHLHVMGKAKHSELIEDTLNPDGTITKFFYKKGQDLTQAPFYKATLSLKQTMGCSAELVDFNLNLTGLKNGQYLALENVTNWLSMGGHSIIISKKIKSTNSMKMAFGHMHAKMPDDCENFMFNLFNKNILNDGIQKIWFQIKDGKDVLTLPFIFNYKKLSKDSNC
ncbi:MAG: hypothetical protein N4A33_00225 [Bacteriovoracaceae bacterium]|jgi:hypothetical protein|nr:hypothetical protein [Bacteriovoracaceae bacterium]